MELGDKHLKVVRASIGFTQAAGLEMGVSAMSMFAATTSLDLEEGRVLQLLNMVTPEELIDKDDYEGSISPSSRSSGLRMIPKAMLMYAKIQKSAKTYKKNVPNTAKSSN